MRKRRAIAEKNTIFSSRMKKTIEKKRRMVYTRIACLKSDVHLHKRRERKLLRQAHNPFPFGSLRKDFPFFSMELLPIVSERTGERTGECLPRHDVIARSMWCQTTNVFVLNSHGELLCHRRSPAKERLPGVWMTHLGGHVGHDETYEQNAAKELLEEAGIASAPTELIHWRTTKIPNARVWVREFAVLKDLPFEKLQPQHGEVDCFAWMSIDEILRSSRTNRAAWCAGTHDLFVEYHCLRAALTAAQHVGAIRPETPIHAWHPLPSA